MWQSEVIVSVQVRNIRSIYFCFLQSVLNASLSNCVGKTQRWKIRKLRNSPITRLSQLSQNSMQFTSCSSVWATGSESQQGTLSRESVLNTLLGTYNHKHLKDLRRFSDTFRESFCLSKVTLIFRLSEPQNTHTCSSAHRCQHWAWFFLPTQLCWPGFLPGGLEPCKSEVSGGSWSLAEGLTNNS